MRVFPKREKCISLFGLMDIPSLPHAVVIRSRGKTGVNVAEGIGRKGPRDGRDYSEEERRGDTSLSSLGEAHTARVIFAKKKTFFVAF